MTRLSKAGEAIDNVPDGKRTDPEALANEEGAAVVDLCIETLCDVCGLTTDDTIIQTLETLKEVPPDTISDERLAELIESARGRSYPNTVSALWELQRRREADR